jgi:hypothetical protein
MFLDLENVYLYPHKCNGKVSDTLSGKHTYIVVQSALIIHTLLESWFSLNI